MARIVARRRASSLGSASGFEFRLSVSCPIVRQKRLAGRALESGSCAASVMTVSSRSVNTSSAGDPSTVAETLDGVEGTIDADARRSAAGASAVIVAASGSTPCPAL